MRFGDWHYLMLGLLITTLGMRVMELLPLVAVVKPILLISVGGFVAFYVSSAGRVLHGAMGSTTARWVLAFLVWTVVCTPFSLWVGRSVEFVQGMVAAVLGVVMLLALPRREDAADRLQRVIVFCTAGFALLNLLFGGQRFDGRFGLSLGIDVNDIALVLVMSAPLAIGLAVRSSSLRSLGYWGLALVIIIAAMRTGSRGAGLALLVSMPVLFFGFRSSIRWRALLFGLPMAGLLLAVAPQSFWERMSSVFTSESDYNLTSVDGRIAVWKRGLRYGLQNPIVGVGPGSFEIADGAGKAELGMTGKWSAAHSAYVQVFAELGIPGGVIFAGALFAVFRRVARHYVRRKESRLPLRPELLATWFAIVVGISFLSFAYVQMLWLMLAALTAMSASLSADQRSTDRPPSVAGTRRPGRRVPRPFEADRVRPPEAPFGLA